MPEFVIHTPPQPPAAQTDDINNRVLINGIHQMLAPMFQQITGNMSNLDQRLQDIHALHLTTNQAQNDYQQKQDKINAGVQQQLDEHQKSTTAQIQELRHTITQLDKR